MKIKITIIILLVLLGCYLFLRALPTYFIHKPIHSTYMSAIKLQEFAGKHNVLFFPTLYKYEVEKYLSVEVPKIEKQMDIEVENAYKIYADFISNPSKQLSSQDYKNQISSFSEYLNYIELDAYIGVLKITDKHLLIPFGALPTCFSDIWASAFMPYIEKYNVDYSKLVELGKHLDKKQNEINSLMEKIENYPIPDIDIKDYRKIASFPKQGVYYYYYKDFNPKNFRKPKEVIPANGSYTMYIYDENLYYNNFLGRSVWNKEEHAYDYIEIKEDDVRYLYDMHIVGLDLKPKYFVHEDNKAKNIDICQFEKDSNLQIKYTIDKSTGKVINKIEFDNGPIGFPNACNPDWIPEMDI